MKRKMLLLTLAIPVILCQNTQAQSSSRLIAQSQWLSNGATFSPNDSTYYSYSHGRGGDLNHTLMYDNAQSWNYLGDTAYSPNLYYLQTFDANNNLLSTITEYWNSATTSWVNWTNVLYAYNSNGSLANTTWQTWGGSSWLNNSQTVCTYSLSGQLFAIQNNLWNNLTTSFSTNNTYNNYTYNSSGKLIQEVDQTYISGAWNYTDEYFYTYSGNELLTTLYLTASGIGYDSVYMYTNTYDSSGDQLTNLYQTYTGSVWANQSLQEYSNFTATGSNLPQLQTNESWDTTGIGSFEPAVRYTYSYNSYGQMTSSIGESWNPGAGWEFALNDPANYYYYDVYSITNSSVKNVVNNGGNANIFPVPAKNILNIDLTWTEAQTATISIFDMSGRQLNKIDVPMGTQYQGTVSVSNLADGMYIVRIDGTQGEIVKQIVVAH